MWTPSIPGTSIPSPATATSRRRSLVSERPSERRSIRSRPSGLGMRDFCQANMRDLQGIIFEGQQATRKITRFSLDIFQKVLKYLSMETRQATSIFEALSSDVRLDLFRLLVKYAPNGLVAGEIAKHLNVTNTNLSFHLKALLHARLVTMEKEGRFLRYRANIPVMLDTIAYLTAECCSGHPEECRNYRAASAVSPAVLPEYHSTKK